MRGLGLACGELRRGSGAKVDPDAVRAGLERAE